MEGRSAAERCVWGRLQALCVCPTRELVVQNLAVLERMAKYTSISATSTASGDSKFSRCARSGCLSAVLRWYQGLVVSSICNMTPKS